MNTANIPELADATKAAKVKKLVIKGDIDDTHILGIKERQSTLSLSNLESISLPDFTGTIPTGYAFYQCTWLKSFEAPHAEGVASAAFCECSSLNYVYLPAARTIDHFAFTSTSLTTVDLPAAQTFNSCAFAGCMELTTVTAPNATFIAEEMFTGCRKLTSVDFLPNVTGIGYDGLRNCSSLTTLNLLSVQDIGDRALDGCTSLTTLKLGYAGIIYLKTRIDYHGVTNGIFGDVALYPDRAKTIDLYLHANHTSEVSGTTWNGYTWKSITYLP
jgi:hypothetical protein